MAPQYTALKEHSDEMQSVDIEPSARCEYWRGSLLAWIALILVQILLLVIYASLFIFGLLSTQVNVQQCVERLSSWSPGLPAVEYNVEYFQGGFTATNEFKGTPSHEIDEAWNRVSLHVPALRLQEQDFTAIGKSMAERDWHRIPEEWGGGYLGMTEVFHLLHCLAEIRKLTYPEHYPDLWEKLGTRGTRVHTDHCLDILRQRIMCTGDIGPVPFYDDPAFVMPMPDFSTRHQCRNFDKILDWGYTNDRAVDWDQVGDLNISQARKGKR